VAGKARGFFHLRKNAQNPRCPWPGKYRLVDIPISNCINSNLKRVYLLTQFNSASLHRHISQSYKFDHFSGGFVEILAAEQTFSDTSWYQGTADAVRKNLVHFLNHDFEYMLILSGDQLYRMDFRRIIAQHVESYADVTIATMPVVRKDATSLGIMEINNERRIVRFAEKPKDPALLDSLRLNREMYDKLDIEGDDEFYLASMGIYVFNREILIRLLDNKDEDFGKHVIPSGHRQLPRFFRRVPGLLGGHRDDPFLLQRQPRRYLRVAALQLFRHERARFHARAFSARIEDQRREESITRSFPTAASSITPPLPIRSSASEAWSARERVEPGDFPGRRLLRIQRVDH
jgi:NDP-sugar pyrophosphorylase family protein